MSTPDPEATARLDSDAVRRQRSRAAGEAQFAPGTMIGGRYRIASILGSGGMGEVYRADDTKLNQTVALKFLPARLERDPTLLARLHDEVRLGRQIAHPNVCHLYDIVEWENAHFVSMEYVDGEDLSRLLRRIGRLAPDKAVDFARGIAAGLAAAHAKGILHRDLKPANIMIDSRGDARIMDFGLALAAGEDDGSISGTPAYMAPEQLEGQPATVQSDLYSFGLVLYELVTGKRAHTARTMLERVRDATSEITTPSSHVRDVDPAVERIILRCLANDPAQRPASAREVILSLPGGDPLAAALAAGETPSPRVVAAAGAEGTLKPWQAWTMLGAIAALMTVFVAFRVSTAPKLDTASDVLWSSASGILKTLGIPANGSPIRYSYVTTGPAPQRFRAEYGVALDVSRHMPIATNAPGWARIEVDERGRLAGLLAAPETDWKAKALDWQPLLAAAGVDAASLRPVAPRKVPAAPFDARAAWNGAYADGRVPIRVEVAAWKGTPVFFTIGEPDDRPPPRDSFGSPVASRLVRVLEIIMLAVAALLAVRNMRNRRGDRQGAIRGALAVFIVQTAGSFFYMAARAGPLTAMSDPASLFGNATKYALYVFVAYLALEPYARRRWPELLIAWARLAAGRVRDPLVARHVLIGIIGGFAHVLLSLTSRPLAAALDGRLADSQPFRIGNLWDTVAALAFSAAAAFSVGALMMIVLVIFTMVLRKRLLAGAIVALFFVAFFCLSVGHRPASIPSYVVIALVMAFLLLRYGPVALVVAYGTFFALIGAPLLPGAGWATASAPVTLAALIALSLWAFHTSLGGQKIFSSSLLDE
ncbi:MAG TPA: serine/threonine-protein kinase [Thermoanaerobaculia bacterium]|nr:serine/threonine-protein kinase [Thermoanaerobaculia bacterium]